MITKEKPQMERSVMSVNKLIEHSEKREKMIEIKLDQELNEKIADHLLDCTDNGMLLYAGTYIKDLERKLFEYRKAEEQGHIVRLPIDRETAVYSIEYCCGLNENNKSGMCFKGLCRECSDRKYYVLEATAEASCEIAELGKSVFFSRGHAEDEISRLEKGEKS